MSTVGVMLSTVADTHYRGGYDDVRGGYHEYREVFSTVGENIFCYLSTPTVLRPHSTHDIPHMYHNIPPRYSNYKGWYPPRY